MKAIALVTQSVLQSGIGEWMRKGCERHGIELAFRNVTESTKDYTELFKAHRNVITWNCRMPHWWLTKWNNNVLCMENSMLCQRAGIFIDQRGFFTNSNLCHLKTWEQEYPSVDLDAFTRKHFQWGAMAGGNPEGPILVCLQSPRDSNMQQQFPLGKDHKDKTEAVLSLLREHLPTGIPVIIRPNPRFLDEWKPEKQSLREDWKVDHSGVFHDILPSYSALVTVNSTCASEAVTLGMPVATLGTGAFTGSGTTLDCSIYPEALKGIATWKPSLEKCERYSNAILGRHFMPYALEGDPPNIEFERWLARAK